MTNRLSNRFVDGWNLELHPGTWISERDDIKLRDECIEYAGKSSHAKSVGRTVEEFLEWLEEADGQRIRVCNEEGETAWIDATHSHSKQYRARYYYALKSIEAYCISEWPSCYTSLITLTSSSRGEKRQYREPVDHLMEIRETWMSHTRKRLHEVLDGTRNAWATVLEPHKTGYAHMHIAVFHDQPIDEMNWHRVVRSHVRNCPGAGKAAHKRGNDTFGEGAVSTRRRSAEDEEEVTEYLGDYVGLTFEEWREMDCAHLVFSACLWATNTRRVRLSQTASRIAQKAAGEQIDNEYVSGWMFVSIDTFDEEGNCIRRSANPSRGGPVMYTVKEVRNRWSEG